MVNALQLVQASQIVVVAILVRENRSLTQHVIVDGRSTALLSSSRMIPGSGEPRGSISLIPYGCRTLPVLSRSRGGIRWPSC